MRLCAALCLLALAGCNSAADAPGPPTQGEASALADAEAMRAEREPPASQ